MGLKEIVNHATEGTRGLAYASSALFLTQIGDVTSTYIGFNQGGYELNPIINNWIAEYSIEQALGIKLAAATIAILTISATQIIGNKFKRKKGEKETKLATYGLYCTSIIMGGIVINNLYQLYLAMQ